MTQFLKVLAAITVVFCSSSSAQVETSNLSPDDTVTYINATLQKYPTLEFVDSGCSGSQQVVAISSDRRSLIIKQNFGRAALGTCDDVQILTAPIFGLKRHSIGDWSRQAQHTSFLLDCTNRIDCFSRRSETRWYAAAANDWTLEMTAPDQVCDQMTKAIGHLLDTLLVEAEGRIDPKEPFLKLAR